MSVRNAALVFALAVMGLSTAAAGTSSTFAGGEIGFIDPPVQSSLTREQVRQELDAFRLSPVVQGGASVRVGGEMGYVDRPIASTTSRAAVRKELLERRVSLAEIFQAP